AEGAHAAVGARESHARRDVRAAPRGPRRGWALGAQDLDLHRHTYRVRAPAVGRVLDEADERGLPEERRLDARHPELTERVTHLIAGAKVGDGHLLPVGHSLLPARAASRRTRSAHTTNGICSGRRPYAAARSRAGRERQSIAIWMFAGNTATNTNAE